MTGQPKAGVWLACFLVVPCAMTGCIVRGVEGVDDYERGPLCSRNMYSGDFVVENEADLERLSTITTVTGQVKIVGTSLAALGPRHCLTEAGGLTITDNPFLDNLKGLELLSIVFGDLTVSGNDQLRSLESFERLTKVTGEIAIDDNSALTDLVGLDSLQRLGGDLSISRNGALESLAGMESIVTVNGDLSVANNDSLESLSGFERLFYVGGVLQVQRNSSLTSLGLDSLSYVGKLLSICGNANLPTCEVDALWSQMGDGEFMNNLEVSGNDDEAGCG